MKARDGFQNVTVVLRGITIITSSFLARPPCRAFFWMATAGWRAGNDAQVADIVRDAPSVMPD